MQLEMTIAKFLQVSDIHDEGDLERIKHVKNLENETKPDATIIPGDLDDTGPYLSIIREFSIKMMELLGLSPKDMQQKELVHEKIAKHKKEIKQIEISGIEKIIKQGKSQIESADKLFGEFVGPVYAVRGNHDLDFIYLMKNVHFLEKQGPAEVKGLKIAGASNTYEKVRGIPDEFYAELEEDQRINNLDEFIERFGSEENYRKFLELNPVYQRMKNQEMDILVCHKGIDELADEFGFGAGLAQIVKEKKPSLILCGHIHGKGLYFPNKNYKGVRSSDEKAYVLHVDTESKDIEQLDIYELS